MPLPLPDPSGSTKYILKRVQGYRPIEISLRFRDGSRALPDSIGIPYPGSVYHVGPEVLRKAGTEELVERKGDLLREDNQTKREIKSLPVQAYITAERPILRSRRGASIRLYWHTPEADIALLPVAAQASGSIDIPVHPSKIAIDSQLGIVEVYEAAPVGKTELIAYYYTEMDETSSRIPEIQWRDIVASGLAQPKVEGDEQLFNSDLGLSQVYPVTRNRTDHLYGKTLELRPPNFERSSPDYYPVYEYRMEPDGTIQFSVPLHPYSDQPAEIEIRYQTLGIEPRLIVDMKRDSDAGISPELPPIQIAVETLT